MDAPTTTLPQWLAARLAARGWTRRRLVRELRAHGLPRASRQLVAAWEAGTVPSTTSMAVLVGLLAQSADDRLHAYGLCAPRRDTGPEDAEAGT